MTCPWCSFSGGRRALHAHLGEEHGDRVNLVEWGGRPEYEVICPLCGAAYRHLVRKGARDPAFLSEFEAQITLVAMDMLLHHLIAEHEPAGIPDGRQPGE